MGGDTAEKLISEFNDTEAEAISIAFMNANPDYVQSDSNRTALVDLLGLTYLQCDTSSADLRELMDDLLVRGFWTVPNLTAAFKILQREGSMEAAEGQAKPLTADDQQMLSISAALVPPRYARRQISTVFLRLT